MLRESISRVNDMERGVLTKSLLGGRSAMSSTTSVTVPVETAGRDLKQLLERLRWGETITLVSSEGTPLAVVVSLKSSSVEGEPVSDWDARWDELVRGVSRVWKSDKSAVEILTEMRR